MLVLFVLNVVVLSDICFSVLITLIESYDLLCVCSSDFIVCLFLIAVTGVNMNTVYVRKLIT